MNQLLYPAALVVIAQVEGIEERDFVLADLVAEQAPRRPVFVPRDAEPACKIAQPRDDDKGHAVLAFTPTHAPHFVIRDEHRVSPDPVLVEAALDIPAEREQADVIK